MASYSSSLILAKIKQGYSDFVIIGLRTEDFNLSSKISETIAKRAGYLDKLPVQPYHTALIGSNSQNGHSYVKDYFDELTIGGSKRNRNICVETTFKSQLHVPTILTILEHVAEHFILITVDECRYSSVLAKDADKACDYFIEKANEFMTKYGFEQRVEAKSGLQAYASHVEEQEETTLFKNVLANSDWTYSSKAHQKFLDLMV